MLSCFHPPFGGGGGSPCWDANLDQIHIGAPTARRPRTPAPLETSYPCLPRGSRSTAPLHLLASILPFSPHILHPPHLALCRLWTNRKRVPVGGVESGATGTDRIGKGTSPLRAFKMGEGPLHAPLGEEIQEAARPLAGWTARASPPLQPRAPHLSHGNSDSSCLQVHEWLCASVNPLQKCDAGSARGEQTHQKLQKVVGMYMAMRPLLAPRARIFMPHSRASPCRSKDQFFQSLTVVPPAAAKEYCHLSVPAWKADGPHLGLKNSPRSHCAPHYHFFPLPLSTPGLSYS